ncbi:hypothetical protein GCM10022197_42970 [Microlunatus spumicola]|uniref:Uncharacterized protein n=1 Tax=Microlunatus spumicola TaxID=81499 RepID=A0ABP6YCU2_9ACTN
MAVVLAASQGGVLQPAATRRAAAAAAAESGRRIFIRKLVSGVRGSSREVVADGGPDVPESDTARISTQEIAEMRAALL